MNAFETHEKVINETTFEDYRNCNHRIEEIESAIYESSLYLGIIMRLESLNKEKQFENGESYSFISKESLTELENKLYFWIDETNRLLTKYNKIIMIKGLEKQKESWETL